jgi:uncharacterized protein
MAQAAERDPAIDAIRGLALLGILVANLSFFAMPGGVAGEWGREAYPGWVDRLASFVIRAGFENSFILSFSFLFGYGAARQLASASAAWFRRRLIGLAVIGILHALLFWAGDVLLAYALIGLMLPVAARWPSHRIYSAVLLLWCFAVLGNTLVGVGLIMLHPPLPDPAAAIALYKSGDFSAIFAVRLMEWAEFYGFGVLVLMPLIAAAFLLGLAAERWLAGRPPSELKQLAPDIRRFFLWPAILGNIAYGVLASAPHGWGQGALLVPEIILRALFAPMLAIVILAWALRFFTSRAGAQVLKLFRINGRLSLSIYVGQSIVCVLLFHGYGAGLYGTIGPAGSLLAALGLFGAMSAIAGAWLRLFGQGPLERLMEIVTPRRDRNGRSWQGDRALEGSGKP